MLDMQEQDYTNLKRQGDIFLCQVRDLSRIESFFYQILYTLFQIRQFDVGVVRIKDTFCTCTEDRQNTYRKYKQDSNDDMYKNQVLKCG